MRLVQMWGWARVSDDLNPLAPEEGIDRFLRHRESGVRDSTMRNTRTRLRLFKQWCEEQEIENLNSLTGRDLADTDCSQSVPYQPSAFGRLSRYTVRAIRMTS